MDTERRDQLAHELGAARSSAQMAEGSLREALRIEDFELAHKALDELELACRDRGSIEDEVVALHTGGTDGIDQVDET